MPPLVRISISVFIPRLQGRTYEVNVMQRPVHVSVTYAHAYSVLILILIYSWSGYAFACIKLRTLDDTYTCVQLNRYALCAFILRALIRASSWCMIKHACVVRESTYVKDSNHAIFLNINPCTSIQGISLEYLVSDYFPH